MDQGHDDKRPAEAGFLPTHRRLLLGCLTIRSCHHADLRNASLVKQIHHADEILDREIPVRSHDDCKVRLFLLERNKSSLEFGRSDHLLVQFDDIIPIDGEGLNLGWVHFGLRGGAARNDQVHAVLHERGRDHEDDQQHEGQIEQRRHIQLTECVQRVAVRESTHGIDAAVSSRYGFRG